MCAELGGYGGLAPKFETTVRMVHDGEVNRARHCPQASTYIATKGPNGDVSVFDYSAHPSSPPDGATRATPQLRLKGHTEEGCVERRASSNSLGDNHDDDNDVIAGSYGLAWSPLEEGRLLSGSDDQLVLMWDTKGRVRAQVGNCWSIIRADTWLDGRLEEVPRCSRRGDSRRTHLWSRTLRGIVTRGNSSHPLATTDC